MTTTAPAAAKPVAVAVTTVSPAASAFSSALSFFERVADAGIEYGINTFVPMASFFGVTAMAESALHSVIAKLQGADIGQQLSEGVLGQVINGGIAVVNELGVTGKAVEIAVVSTLTRWGMLPKGTTAASLGL